MAYKMNKDGGFTAIKTDKVKEETALKKLDAKILELETAGAAKDAKILELETMIAELSKKPE